MKGVVILTDRRAVQWPAVRVAVSRCKHGAGAGMLWPPGMAALPTGHEPLNSTSGDEERVGQSLAMLRRR